jgi:hypothetical protein
LHNMHLQFLNILCRFAFPHLFDVTLYEGSNSALGLTRLLNYSYPGHNKKRGRKCSQNFVAVKMKIYWMCIHIQRVKWMKFISCWCKVQSEVNIWWTFGGMQCNMYYAMPEKLHASCRRNGFLLHESQNEGRKLISSIAAKKPSSSSQFPDQPQCAFPIKIHRYT